MLLLLMRSSKTDELLANAGNFERVSGCQSEPLRKGWIEALRSKQPEPDPARMLQVACLSRRA